MPSIWWLSFLNSIYILIFYVPHLIIIYPSFQSIYTAFLALASLFYLWNERREFKFWRCSMRFVLATFLGLLTAYNGSLLLMKELGVISIAPLLPELQGFYPMLPSPFTPLDWITPVSPFGQ